MPLSSLVPRCLNLQVIIDLPCHERKNGGHEETEESGEQHGLHLFVHEDGRQHQFNCFDRHCAFGMAVLFPVLELVCFVQGLIRRHQILIASLYLFFLAFQFIPVDLVRVVLLAEFAVSVPDLFGVERAVIFDMQQGIRVPLAGEALVLFDHIDCQHRPSSEQADHYSFHDESFGALVHSSLGQHGEQ